VSLLILTGYGKIEQVWAPSVLLRGATVSIPYKLMNKIRPALPIVFAATLLGLTGCGFDSRSVAPGTFSGTTARQKDPITGALASHTAVASVTLSPARLVGGDSAAITVKLTGPAPDGGVALQLKSSNPSLVAIPATVRIPAGESSATILASTSVVDSGATVSISVLSGDSVSGGALNIDAAVKPAFSIAVQPSTITISAGDTGSATVTTTVTEGFDEALELTHSRGAKGALVTLTPTQIPAPGAGTADLQITVADTVAAGAYSIRVIASDGSKTHVATLTLNVTSATSDPGAKFQGCWYKTNGNSYQGTTITVENPGTYPFDAVLYYGTACNPNNWADEFGFGTPLYFPGAPYEWTFWFNAFANQTDMSAYWYVGSDKSKCVNYSVAPAC
jgi:hypothetical protein